MDEAMIRKRCEEWIVEIMSRDNPMMKHFIPSERDIAYVCKFYRAAYTDGQRDERKRAAKILTDEVVEHRKMSGGEHQYCDDYGCHYIETLADKIRQAAGEVTGG